MSAVLVWLVSMVIFTGFVQSEQEERNVECSFDEISGEWIFYIGERGKDKTLDCSSMSTADYQTTMRVKLEYPDVAIDEYTNRGFWTMVGLWGFEVIVHGRKFFSYSNFTNVGDFTLCFCDQTVISTSQNLLGNDWACFYGQKTVPLPPKKLRYRSGDEEQNRNSMFRIDRKQIDDINSAQHSWKAKYYPQFDRMTVGEFDRMTGRKAVNNYPEPAKATREMQQRTTRLPKQWDWRDVNGINYVTPVRQQEYCGSCYAFASAAMNEARLRVASNNTIQLTFSPQDIVDCSPYTGGCNGGWDYLVSGKYAEVYGLVEESCNPYTGSERETCTTNSSCTRHYSTSYGYVGGYYGACNEEQMMLELYERGPFVIEFLVLNDLFVYDSGIYHHTEYSSRYNEFQDINHAVLLVGYGVDPVTGEKYWTFKNSWGIWWGEKGYARIRRGNNECAFESSAVKSNPIF